MNRNVEIKARVRDMESMTARVKVLADEGPVILNQEDTFFLCPEGRLKLRQFSESEGELIFYNRPDSVEPTQSQYLISRTSDPGSLRKILSEVLGVRNVVRKTRVLYLVGQSRIHLDTVDELGEFVEIEFVLQPEQSVTFGTRVVERWMKSLGISRSDLVTGSYIDLSERGGD